MVRHYALRLPPFSRGYHLITDQVMAAVEEWPQNAMLEVFIRHTSAALTINENADPSVRVDLERSFDQLAPENQAFYTHTMEGPDDMPAHIKAALMGSSVRIPVVDGRPALGTWQGIYLCEFRNRAAGRELIISLIS